MRLYVVLVVAAVSVTFLTACPQCKTPATGSQVKDRFVKVERPIPGEYVVVLKPPAEGVAPPSMTDLAATMATARSRLGTPDMVLSPAFDMAGASFNLTRPLTEKLLAA